MVTDTARPPQRHKHTDRTDYNTLRRSWLARSVTTDQMFMKFYEMVGHNPTTNDARSRSLEVKSSKLFLPITPFKIVMESSQK